MHTLRTIAIHLPQFHPIAENDEWWGKGFTEWTNVAKAKPLFKDHYQPHFPADLGYYDLRLEEARLAQEALAKAYGIKGFCYYHYWFNGKRLLNEPVDRKLKNPKEDLSFMLCWANENWSRRWDGQDQDILMHQEHSEKDDKEHIQFLCQKFFSDPRYIKVYNKPFFIIYRPSLFPDFKKTIALWRAEARSMGIGELYIGYMTSFNQMYDLEEYGLDIAIEFAPNFYNSTREFGNIRNKFIQKTSHYRNRLFIKLGNKTLSSVNKSIEYFFDKHIYNFQLKNYIIDYSTMVNKEVTREINKRTFPGIFPMWDNTARKKGKNGLICLGSTPELYKKWLISIKKRFTPISAEENFVFINAWNEWAEGNHLEPCHKWGHEYLKATKEALE